MRNPYFLIAPPSLNGKDTIIEVIYYEITPADLSVGLEETVDVDWIFIEDPVNDVAFINELIPRLLMARLEEENEADPVLLDCG